MVTVTVTVTVTNVINVTNVTQKVVKNASKRTQNYTKVVKNKKSCFSRLLGVLGQF